MKGGRCFSDVPIIRRTALIGCRVRFPLSYDLLHGLNSSFAIEAAS